MAKDVDEARPTLIEQLNRGTQEAHQRRDELAAAVDELATGLTTLGMKPWKYTRKSLVDWRMGRPTPLPRDTRRLQREGEPRS